MNLSRRGLFGAGVGAAVAGPAAVKSALASVPGVSSGLLEKASYGTPGIYGANTACAVEGPSSIWMEREIKDLVTRKQKLASEIKPRLGLVADHRIDNLRSVSVTNRARMIAEETARRELACEVSWLDDRIGDLKKQMGLLGFLIPGDVP